MATFNFNAPDGSSYTINGPDGASEQEAFAQLQRGIQSGAIKPNAPAKPAAPATDEANAGGFAKGVADIAGTGLLNTAHGMAAGLEHIGRLILGGPGGPGTVMNKDGSRSSMIDGNPDNTSVSDHVPQAHLGPSGQAVSQAVASTPIVQGATDAATQADQWLQQNAPTFHKALHGALGTAGAIANVAGPAALAKGGVSALREASADATPEVTSAVEPRSAPPQKPIPQDASPVANLLAGSSADDAKAIANQKLGDSQLATVAGHDPAARMSDASLAEAAMPANSVYNRLAQELPTQAIPADDPARAAVAKVESGGSIDKGTDPAIVNRIQRIKDSVLNNTHSGDDLLNGVRTLRQDGFKNAASEDVGNNTLGSAQLDIANALDDYVKRIMPAGGTVSPEMFEEARTALAQNHAVRGILDENTGHVDLQALARLNNKKPGVLTGPLKDWAEFAGNNPLVARKITSIKTPGALSDVRGIDIKNPTSLLQAVGGGALGRRLATGGADEALAAARSAPVDASRFDPLDPLRNGLQAPPGTAFEAHQPNLATGAPTQRDFFGYGTGGMRAETPPIGGAAARSGDIPLSEVLSTGVERPPEPGLSLAPEGQFPTAGAGIPYRLNHDFMAGDLSLGDQLAGEPRENLSDVAGVRSQGVPEGIVQRTQQVSRSGGKPPLGDKFGGEPPSAPPALPAPPTPSAAPTPKASSVTPIQQRILDAYTSLVPGGNGRAMLADLRDRLPDIPKADFDREIQHMTTSRGIGSLMREDNNTNLAQNPRFKQAAITLGGSPRHLLFVTGRDLAKANAK